MRISYVKDCVDDIVSTAIAWGIPLEKGIEFFCGDGSLYSGLLSMRINALTGLDIDLEKGKVLIANYPNVNFLHTDSNVYAREYSGDGYDIVSFDNPLCVYGDYCEHFDILPYAHKFVNKDRKTLVAIDIVHTPYNLEAPENINWVKRRMDYYAISSGNLDLDYAVRFYTDKLTKQGLKVYDIRCICREIHESNDYFYMIVCIVGKE